MKYSTFCDYLDRLEKTSKRLEITAILAKLIKELDAQEMAQAIYLSLGYLNPPYNQIKFNMADKMVIRSLSLCYNTSHEKVTKLYSEAGDLGNVASVILACPESDSGLPSVARMTKTSRQNDSIIEMHRELVKLASDDGSGSQERKIAALSDLLKRLSPISAKYTVRIVLGTTRLGFTEQTMIDALSTTLEGNKSVSRKIEEKYNIHPDVGFIAQVLKETGVKGLNKICIETGVPVLSQKAQRLSDSKEIIEKMEGPAWMEYKLDGTRVQLHMDRSKRGSDTKLNQNSLFDFNKSQVMVKTFTRNLEENTYQFPDIAQSALKQIDAESVILDGEAIGFDPKSGKYIPFQDMMQRKRKHDVGDYAKQIPLKYIVFDILYLNGQDLTARSLLDRHKLLDKIIKRAGVLEIAEHVETTDPKTLWKHFESSKEKNLEGIMIKNVTSPYRAGAREFSWIKLKRSNTELLEDTVDCVVLGYYFGRGTRADFGIGGFLCGIWNSETETFVTLTKVGTGLTDEEWVALKERCDGLKLKEPLKNVKVPKLLIPDVWVRPEIVVELGGDEITISKTHTSGYALRFPRLIKYRNDKSPTDTTSPAEILALHNSQRQT